MNVLAIDPGNIESAYCIIDSGTLSPIMFDKTANNNIMRIIKTPMGYDRSAIEMVACYGMPVGKEVFDTCVWIGRFAEAIDRVSIDANFIYRKDEKMHICGSMKAKDSNIIQALKDRFGDKGTKSNPGWFYGFSKDIWQAYACGLVYIETRLNNEKV